MAKFQKLFGAIEYLPTVDSDLIYLISHFVLSSTVNSIWRQTTYAAAQAGAT